MSMKHVTKTYGQAEEAYRRLARRPKHGGPPRVNMGYATWLNRRHMPEGRLAYAVTFHQTDVVTYLPHGGVLLATGGWLTVTTRRRIETYTPNNVWVRTRGVPRQRHATTPVEFVVLFKDADGIVSEFDLSAGGTALFDPLG